MSVALALKEWSLEELHSLPADGNKYELLDGELLVTPAPAPIHELILVRLDAILMPWVRAQGLGYVYRPRAVIRQKPRSEVEPDLFVSHEIRDYDAAPVPSLVVEVLSPYTRRRDHEHKRDYYLAVKLIPEYWVIDPDARTIRVLRAGESDRVVVGQMTWAPRGALEPITFDASVLFT